MVDLISPWAADIIAILFSLVAIAFGIVVLWVVVRAAKVLNNYFTLLDYKNAYDKGLWQIRSEKSGVPLVWEAREEGWKEKMEKELTEAQSKTGKK